MTAPRAETTPRNTRRGVHSDSGCGVVCTATSDATRCGGGTAWWREVEVDGGVRRVVGAQPGGGTWSQSRVLSFEPWLTCNSCSSSSSVAQRASVATPNACAPLITAACDTRRKRTRRPDVNADASRVHGLARAAWRPHGARARDARASSAASSCCSGSGHASSPYSSTIGARPPSGAAPRSTWPWQRCGWRPRLRSRSSPK